LIDLTVSRRYARALMMLGQDDGKYKEYGDELKVLPSSWSGNRN